MKRQKMFWGIFLIGAAILILVDRLGLIQFPNINVFRLLLTVLFVAGFVNALIDRNFTGMFFSLAFLAIIYARPLGITAITPWTVLGIACLLSIGFSLLFPKTHHSYHGNGRETHVDQVVDEQDVGTIYYANTFSSGIKYINTDNYQGADLKCTFGGMKVYFDRAIIQNGQSYANLNVSFGGVELYIPKTWRVVDQVKASFGGVEEKNHPVSEGNPTLYLTGNVSFGGITVIYI